MKVCFEKITFLFRIIRMLQYSYICQNVTSSLNFDQNFLTSSRTSRLVFLKPMHLTKDNPLIIRNHRMSFIVETYSRLTSRTPLSRFLLYPRIKGSFSRLIKPHFDLIVNQPCLDLIINKAEINVNDDFMNHFARGHYYHWTMLKLMRVCQEWTI